MIHTSRQLKALVRNISKGDSGKAQVVIRNYVMERFLERLSLSQYRNIMILKGGTLVAAMVGLDNRSTMDVDATLKNLPLNEDSARKIVEEITAIHIEDGMIFEIKSVTPIMDEADYPGIRIMLDTAIETMHTPLKIDFSTGDVITPREVSYSFRLLFEERTISILAYNLETVLAEKLETLLARGTANTRMRDYYDIYVLTNTQKHNIDNATLKEAFVNTSAKRGSIGLLSDVHLILKEVTESIVLIDRWKNYQRKFDYAADVLWATVMESVSCLVDIVK
ncbi:nucleotidyl transferase AbiEii/AbiGii toxin family protein [Megasphaera cerevisiae]|jgi:predicted nucleotidyltransferase component of viral defense system|uniref:nucleotidyl transferase AbiEii/AbiGii toxin family protein n=1 Tax=Megasphaera cerevisiae TaxID=39029 RepID=UPI000945D14E|nr:nucleotidyl transferase AbiEii/AbiGii toxin family protein [Megasphaera cerevisiae]OKY53527.1 abortive phage infection protein [Megasphaera cerevisiae]